MNAAAARLDKLLPMQRSDFTEIFRIMAGLPVTILLLIPAARILAHTEEDIAGVAKQSGVSAELLRAAHLQLRVNPMLGHRGCRLGVAIPKSEMQAGHLRSRPRCRGSGGRRSPK
jgi:pyruvate,orthophosphate dikinase